MITKNLFACINDSFFVFNFYKLDLYKISKNSEKFHNPEYVSDLFQYILNTVYLILLIIRINVKFSIYTNHVTNIRSDQILRRYGH